MIEVIIYGDDFYRKRELLEKVRVDAVNWLVYYIDNSTGEKWVEEYIYPEMQGGGPPQLRLINLFPWENISSGFV